MSAVPNNTNACKYKPEFCEMLLDHMAEGYSLESFGAIAKVGKKTLYNWKDTYADWKEAVEIGELLALKYFETSIKSASTNESIYDKVLQRKFDPKNINVPTMQWFVKTRFHTIYSEKNVTVIEGGDKPVQFENKGDNLKNLSLEELKALQAIRAKIDGEPSK